MALEALVGGKCLHLLLNSVLTSGSLPLMTTPLSQMSLIGTIT
jgi:cytosine/uracil/thiamine/allantoin permease